MRTVYQSHQCTGRLAGQYPRISPGNRAPFWPTACGAEYPDPTVFRTSSANCCRSSKRRESSRVGSWWDARKYFAISVANLWRSQSKWVRWRLGLTPESSAWTTRATPYAYANETQPRSYRGEQRPKSTASSDPGKRSTN